MTLIAISVIRNHMKKRKEKQLSSSSSSLTHKEDSRSLLRNDDLSQGTELTVCALSGFDDDTLESISLPDKPETGGLCTTPPETVMVAGRESSPGAEPPHHPPQWRQIFPNKYEHVEYGGNAPVAWITIVH